MKVSGFPFEVRLLLGVVSLVLRIHQKVRHRGRFAQQGVTRLLSP